MQRLRRSTALRAIACAAFLVPAVATAFPASTLGADSDTQRSNREAAARAAAKVQALDDRINHLEGALGVNLSFVGLIGVPYIYYIQRRIQDFANTRAYFANIAAADPLAGDPPIADIAPLVPGNDVLGFGVGLDASGKFVAVGWGYQGANNGYARAFRWTEATGTVDLGVLPGSIQPGTSFAYGLSDDTTTIVGEGTTAVAGDTHAFRWTAALGMQDLGVLPGQSGDSVAYGANRNGSVVVGSSVLQDFFGTPRPTAFRWVLTNSLTGQGTMTSLGTLPGGNSSVAYDITPDGAFVVGSSLIAGNAYHPFLWSQTSGQMADLGTPAGMGVGIATAVSDDGSVVVGITNVGGTFDNISRTVQGYVHSDNARATRWTAATGTQDLNALLSASGVNMTGIVLRTATSVTPDGQFIGGEGIFPNSAEEGGYLVRYCDPTVEAACIAYSESRGVLGMTTDESVTSSAGVVAAQYHAVGAQLGGTADLLLGLGQPVEAPDSFGAVAAVGSVTLGANAHWNFDKGFSLNAGAGFVDQSASGASTTGALLGASVRYVHSVPVGDTGLTPFAEAGAWGSPNLSMTFSRTYANGAGTATGTGTAAGSIFGLFAKAGVLYAPTVDDDVVFSATIAHNWLSVGGYTEALSAANPFPATFAAVASQTSQIKAGVEWTHAITPQLDFTLSAALGSSFGSTSTSSATVAGLGTVTGTAGDYGFGQLGARLSYKVSDKVDIEGFVVSTFGSQIGTHTQVGGGLHVSF